MEINDESHVAASVGSDFAVGEISAVLRQHPSEMAPGPANGGRATARSAGGASLIGRLSSWSYLRVFLPGECKRFRRMTRCCRDHPSDRGKELKFLDTSLELKPDKALQVLIPPWTGGPEEIPQIVRTRKETPKEELQRSSEQGATLRALFLGSAHSSRHSQESSTEQHQAGRLRRNDRLPFSGFQIQ
jgi:hypothetical protein